jgi:two-component system response regulator FixJ
MTTEPGTVHVIDDDDAVRDSVAFLLGTEGMRVATYDSAPGFLRSADKASGCVVADVRMPDMDGIELLRQLAGRGIKLPVIIITGHGDIPLAVEAMKAGAVDFIEKPFDDALLLGAIRTALRAAVGRAEREAERLAILERLDLLSTRERQVLEGIVPGRANKVIAFDLGISPRTVEVYRANLMSKLEAGSVSDLVRMAIVSGSA